MQEILKQVAAVAQLRKEATPGPWVQWAEHPSVYAGPAEQNEPWTIRGVRVQIAECRIDQESDMMSDFDEEQGPYDGGANAAFIAAVGGLDFEAVAAALGAAAPAPLADAELADLAIWDANRFQETRQWVNDVLAGPINSLVLEVIDQASGLLARLAAAEARVARWTPASDFTPTKARPEKVARRIGGVEGHWSICWAHYDGCQWLHDHDKHVLNVEYILIDAADAVLPAYAPAPIVE